MAHPLDLGAKITAKKNPPKSSAQVACEAKGGRWDEVNKVCILPEPPKPEPKPDPVTPPIIQSNIPETFTQGETGRASGIEKSGVGKYHIPTGRKLPDGSNETKKVGIDEYNAYRRSIGVAEVQDRATYLGLSPEDVSTIAAGEAARTARPEGTAPVGSAAAVSERQTESLELAQGVGQFDPLGLSQERILDKGEALTTGAIDAIPSAIRLAGQFGAAGAVVGAAGGPAAPVTIPAAAAIGAATGFIAGIVGGMTSNFKSQRTDTTTAQQRTLDEGKQTMKDWATMAKTDPANRPFYLSEYNKQAALINQAYRQMKYDTSRDVGKFETALPNLAEFETFYSPGGERDTLDIEMQNSLLAPPAPDYEMLELASRRVGA